MRKCFCGRPSSTPSLDERHCDGMSCAATMDDLRVDPSARKCSTSSTSSAGSIMSFEDQDAAAVPVAVDDVTATGSVDDGGDDGDGGGAGGGHPYTVAVVTANRSPDSEIHTDRDDCSSDESNGPDSPTGLKRAGSVYDFRLDGSDSPPPGNNNHSNSNSCSNNNPFAAGPDADLTKVARKQLRMIREVDVAVCHLNHTNTIISKILSSKYLRRWENHQIRLQDDCITSNTVCEIFFVHTRKIRIIIDKTGARWCKMRYLFCGGGRVRGFVNIFDIYKIYYEFYNSFFTIKNKIFFRF